MQSECRTSKRVRRESPAVSFPVRADSTREKRKSFSTNQRSDKLPGNNSSSRAVNDADFFVVPTNCNNRAKLSVYSSDKIGRQLLPRIKRICQRARKVFQEKITSCWIFYKFFPFERSISFYITPNIIAYWRDILKCFFARVYNIWKREERFQ